MDYSQIVRSKLIPPIPSTTYMRRAAFIKKLNEARMKKLTIIHSDAGYGKSLGLAQYVKDSGDRFSWYTVSEADDDLIPFLAYLKASIQRVIPRFGASLNSWIPPSDYYPSDRDLQQWVTLFINALCDLDATLTIIIDDFHLIDHVFLVNFMLEEVIELLPPHVNVIIVSRTYPKWTNLIKLKANNQLCEITEEDLMFTEEEISVYYEDYYSISLKDKESRDIMHLTEGWAIAVNLLALQMSQSKVAFNLAVSPVLEDVFTYLSEEVFQQLSSEMQDWLLAFAIFETFSEKLLLRFYNEEAVEVLRALSKNHSFIQLLDEEGSYRYHALFHQFLQDKWQQINSNKYIKLHKQAAKLFQQEKNSIQSTYHAMQTADEQFICEILEHSAPELIRAGQFDWF
ncbi:hypothetical protein ACLIBH_10890 [Virgibacillus sp. W0430]|uniref:hypothetical protein n=1 Tax=Virgibacillus sp. W0430 TaxID=3391580 RepID=UPI003F48A4D9